jgi:hypothetical protein
MLWFRYLWSTANSPSQPQQLQTLLSPPQLDSLSKSLPTQQQPAQVQSATQWVLAGVFGDLGYTNPITTVAWQPVTIQSLQQPQPGHHFPHHHHPEHHHPTTHLANGAPCPLLAACSFGTNRHVTLFRIPRLVLKVFHVFLIELHS